MAKVADDEASAEADDGADAGDMHGDGARVAAPPKGVKLRAQRWRGHPLRHWRKSARLAWRAQEVAGRSPQQTVCGGSVSRVAWCG